MGASTSLMEVLYSTKSQKWAYKPHIKKQLARKIPLLVNYNDDFYADFSRLCSNDLKDTKRQYETHIIYYLNVRFREIFIYSNFSNRLYVSLICYISGPTKIHKHKQKSKAHLWANFSALIGASGTVVSASARFL